METEGYITKKKKGSSLYKALHQEALEIVQKLSGAIWTDYNEHDPGVTLLENLVYAITELDHKSRLSIKDLLIPEEDKKLDSGDNGFFTASDILSTGPITFNDYRKIWIDQVVNIKNVWIHPIDRVDGNIRNTKGLMYVFVEKYTYWSDPEEEKEDNLRIIKEVRHIYHRQRNLCEDIFRLKIFKPLDLSMNFKIELSDEVDGEEILANIFYKINNYLAPEVSYYSLWKLQEEKKNINEIFNGPNLSSGFILEEDLKDALKQIVVSEIITLISQIPGIISIPHFYLNYSDPETQKNIEIQDTFDVPEYTTAALLFPTFNGELVFENSGVLFNPDLEETKKQLAFIQALNYGKFRKASSSLNNIPIPQGNYQDIMSYYPIRKQFPELYGIGDIGIGSRATTLRKAQVKQLQGYLMPFDQLMINFLAQLRNIHTLYEVNDTNDISYFTHDLPDIGQLLDLVKLPESGEDAGEIKGHWEEILNDLNIRYDDHALNRFNVITDHLLARFNETFKTYPLRKINSNSYGEALASEKFEKELLRAKRKLVQEYASISYNRAKSFDYQQLKVSSPGMEEKQVQFIPGTIRKIAILLGINDFEVRSLTKDMAGSSLTIQPRTKGLEIKVSEIDISISKDHIHIVDIEDVVIEGAIKRDLYDVMHYVGNEDTILENVLKNGILPMNYTIQQDPNVDALYYIMYKRASGKSNIAHISKSKDGAANAIKKAIAYLLEINQKSEGFFVVEHLLLLPPYSMPYFGFHIDFAILFKEIDLKIQHKELNSCQKRDGILTDFIDLLYAGKLKFTAIPHKKEYGLEITSPDGEALVISRNRYASKELALKQVKILEDRIDDLEKEKLESAVVCNVYYGKKTVDEAFFSFRLSFVAPSWPVRFQSDNFKRMFENTIYEEVPIHIASSIFWVDYLAFQKFETSYFKWLELLKLKDTIENRMDEAYRLIVMLQQWNEKYSKF